MYKSIIHFYRLIKRVFIIDVIKYYWIVILKSKTNNAYRIRLYNGLEIKIVPKAGDYCTFHEIFIKEDYNFKNIINPLNILDIGANVGFFSLYASKKYNTSKIFSFEPFPPTYLRLKEHISTNKIENVITFPYAVSDKKGKVNFYSIDWAGANTLNSDKFDIDNCKITQVDCISFSDIFELTKIDMFDLAKIDCEGSEFPILINTSDESILKIRNFIIEVHTDKIYSANDLIVKFKRLGYKTEYKNDILIASLCEPHDLIMQKKVIYIQQCIKGSGYHPSMDMYPNYFTYGFGGRSGRMFKKYNPSWDVEVWRLDSSVNKVIETDYENMHFSVFPARGNSKIGIYSLKFIRALRQLPRDTILNVQNIHNLLLYQILLFSPSRLIITAQHHGDYHPSFILKNAKGIKRVKACFSLIIEKCLINRVSHFFIIDVDHIDFLHRTVKNLVEKYSIQSLGIDFSMYKKIPKGEACREIGLDPDKKYLFYIGQYYHLKEVDRLCEVYKKVKGIDPEIQMFVAGGTSTDRYYKNIIQCGAIDFGKIPNNELYKFYSAADVYVCMAFRPDYFGGVGLAMLEAMASGTPVVCKSLENIPENIRQFVGKRPSDENEMVQDILEVINNRENYSDCRKYIEELYDYSIIQKNTSRVYENLLKQQLND